MQMNTHSPDIHHKELADSLKIILNDRLNISLNQIAEFCQYWNIIEFALFGSVLRDDFRPDSDIDILVTFSPEYRLTFRDWLDMQKQIQEILEREVDLTQKNLLKNPYTRSEILKTYQVIYNSTTIPISS